MFKLLMWGANVDETTPCACLYECGSGGQEVSLAWTFPSGTCNEGFPTLCCPDVADSTSNELIETISPWAIVVSVDQIGEFSRANKQMKDVE